MGTMEVSTALWVAAGFLTVIGSLIGLLWNIAWTAIKDLRIENTALREAASARSKELHDKIDSKAVEAHAQAEKDRDECRARDKEIFEKVESEREDRVKAHNETAQRAFDEIEKVRDKHDAEIDATKGTVADLRETVAGFGSIYATRKEIEERRTEG